MITYYSQKKTDNMKIESRACVSMRIEDPYERLGPMYTPHINVKKGNKEHETRLNNRRR